MYLILCLVLFISNKIVSSTDIYGPQPRIISLNGHLIFQGAEHKNISFNTKGRGKIHINGVDITKTRPDLEMNELVERYKLDVGESLTRLSKLEKTFDEDLLQKIAALKNDSRSSAVYPISNPSVNRILRRLNRRVNILQRRLNTMSTLLVTDECISDPCKNGGTCVDLYKKFLCHCPVEWEGPTCEKDVNECAIYAGTELGCQNGASCVNFQGSYECECRPGWFGIYCNRRSADCNSGSSLELCGHGTCINQNNVVGYKCLCDPGWTTDGKTEACNTDIDECLQFKPSCSSDPPVQCINLPGTFHCGTCPLGYTGNGFYCNDIDECNTQTVCSVNPKVSCINTRGSYVCGNCPPGYAGDGKVCTYHGICNVNNGGCHHMATCHDDPRETYIRCTCPIGYVGSGFGPNGCVSTGLVPADSCSPNPCKHGQCEINNATGGYNCICPATYEGKDCDKARDLCKSNPCQNGAVCRSIFGLRYLCSCPRGYTGNQCQMRTEQCGGFLLEDSGQIKYPQDTEIVGQSIHCFWMIRSSNVSVVFNITFKEFSIGNDSESSNCGQNALTISTYRSDGHKIERLCGQKLPKSIVFINPVAIRLSAESSSPRPRFELTWEPIPPICGGDINVTSHGTIESSTFSKLFVNRDCYWRLSAPLSKRIVFHFFSLVLGSKSDCSGDYLELTSTDVVFAKYCNDSHPSPLYSPGPEVTVHLHYDAHHINEYFQISYALTEGIPGCGGVYTNYIGEIHSPILDGEYPPHVQCEYLIKLTGKSRITLTFTKFDLEDSVNCEYDYVSIHAGTTSESPLIGKYCGNKVPASYVTNNNDILIVFVTDYALAGEGFVLNYEGECGKKLTSPSGSFEASGTSASAIRAYSCSYQIEQPLGKSIVLNINIKHTNWVEDCTENYIEVRDGENENSPLIGRYCEKVPTEIISTMNYAFVKLYTHNPTFGFEANYSSIQTGCGGILKAPTGTISSPRHPDVYSGNMNCTWVLSADPGYVVKLSWVTFNLESSYDCQYDYVQIYDNNTDTGEGSLVGQFCGQKSPPLILSTSSIVTIRFITDPTIHTEGFLAAYTFLKESNVCGGNFYSSAGTIKSPYYPSEYGLNMECTWVITVKAGQQIMLKIEDFQLEEYHACKYDWLEIRNGATISSPLIGRYCGTDIPKNIPSHSHQLHLHFKSDMTKTDRGFKIYWDSTTTGCGGALTAPTGSIVSPNYPEPYAQNAECIWKISVSAGSVIDIVFSDLVLEHHSVCNLDYVEVIDGPTTNSKSLGRFCSEHPPYLKSSSNHMIVKFISDLSISERGFQLQYTTSCNNTMSGIRGVIESPNFPQNYPHDLNCNWKINVPIGNKINISFTHFDLELGSGDSENDISKCDYDFLKIYSLPLNSDETEESSFVQHGKYCGTKVPPLITLDSHMAKIHMQTDNFLHGIGFRLEWHVFGCGGLFTKPTGTFSTPNYPKHYPPNMECLWKIEVPFGNNIQLTFSQIDIEKDFECTYDGVRIYNGEDATYPEMAHLCHQTKPTVITSTSNTLYIKFHSDSSYEGRGFNANYTIVPGKCGGKFTAAKGKIMSPNYPNNYNKEETCTYLIEGDEGHVLNFKFEDFDLAVPEGGNCTDHTHLKIYDGQSTEYAMLDTLCGKQTNKSYSSSSNSLYVVMISNDYDTSKGFLATYSRACGAQIVTSDTGTISLNPNEFHQEYNELTDTFGNCSWTITSSDPSKHVSLTITHFHSNIYYECEQYEFLRIYNGENSQSPLVGSYCGTKIPPMITSNGASLHITVDFNTVLRATYTVFDSACGGTLTSMEGQFTSPGFPNSYPMNIECEWNIQFSQGNYVSLSFHTFDLLASPNCDTDYLEIRRNNSSGKLLGNFCGDNQPTNITNEPNLWLFLKTSSIEDESVTIPKGFSAEYALQHNQELSGKTGVIESPLSGLRYSVYGDFTWKVTVDFGNQILITFKELLMESPSLGFCSSRLEIYDGSDEEAPTIGTLCGSHIPDPIKSSSNVVIVKAFMFPIAKTDIYFKLEWLAVDISTAELEQQFSAIKNKSCGTKDIIDLNVLQNSTAIQSPGYPYGYAPNLECEWIITTIPMNHLRMTINDLSMEMNYFGFACYTDYLQIFQRRIDSDWEEVYKICRENATDPHAEFVTTNFMKVVFVTNAADNGTGFSATVKEECGGLLTDPSGVITYDNNTRARYHFRRMIITCQWNVSVRAGKRISVELDLNILQLHADNCDNYIMLRNGLSEASPLLQKGKYCDRTIAAKPDGALLTSGNHLHIKYHGYSDLANFNIKYSEVSHDCGGDINLSQFSKSTTISSPNYPNIPSPHIDCTWKIMAPPSERLRIDFEHRFDLTSNEGCTKEYVEVRDGGSEYSPIIGRYCKKIPNSQFTTDNVMFVKFFTDVHDPGNGFTANISIANCGGTYHSTLGHIYSPFFNMKHKYPANMNCTWHIIAPVDHTLKIDFDKVDLRTSDEESVCESTDSVRIFDVIPDSEERSWLQDACGNNIPPTIESSSHHVIINFATGKEKRELNGFSLRYNATEKTCGKAIQANEGYIQYPTLRRAGPAHAVHCSWTITVPKGRRVKLEVLEFDIDDTFEDYLRALIFTNAEEEYNSRKITPKSANKVIKSSDNTLYMYYWDRSINGKGFKVRFSSDEPSICTGDINQDSGVITQPAEEISTYYCTYIRVKQYTNPSTVAVVIDAFSNRTRKIYDNFCSVMRFATTEFIAVTTVDNKLIGMECITREAHNIFRIPYNNFKIQTMQTTAALLNYTISYTTYPCGGILTEEMSNFASPSYPNPDSKAECAWLIKIPAEQSILLTIEEMDLGDNCELSYLEIYNGDSRTSPKIDKYCNNKKPEPFKSQRNSLLIEYKYDKKSNGKGFKAKYEPIIEGCGGVYQDQNLIIQTPNYPKQYPNNAECVWELRSDEGFHIGFRVVSRFNIETSANCKNDFVEIFDWVNNSWSSLGRYCGRDFKTFNSTGNRMKVMFRSNEQITGTGFRASWDWNCGGTFPVDRKQRFIVSPGYPVKYPKDIYCLYNFTTPTSIDYVNIDFYDFALEGHQSLCTFDNLTITRSLGQDTGRTFYIPDTKQVYCGTKLPTSVRIQTPLFIIFQTDAYVQRTGFKFSYQLDDCGGDVDSPRVIKSPVLKKLPITQLTTSHRTCQWNITAPEDKIIIIQFEKFFFKYRGYCYFDGVEIYEGQNIHVYNKRLATLCGDLNKDPPSIRVQNNTALIILRTDNELENQGFEATIYFMNGPKAGCGGNLNVTNEMQLRSANLWNIDCFWTITAPVDMIIELTFTHIALPPRCGYTTNDTCHCGFIEIRDGSSTYSELIEKICSTQNGDANKTVVTTANVASIRLAAEGWNADDAFRLNIKAVQTQCGPLYLNATSAIQTFQSPNYPNGYPSNLKCTWVIKSDSKFVIHFVDFDLGGGNEDSTKNLCSGDTLKIIDDPSAHVISEDLGPNTIISGTRKQTSDFQQYLNVDGIHQFCGKSDKIFDYYSQNNALTVTFSSGNTDIAHGKGFKFEYHQAGCNRNYTSHQGRIVIHNMEKPCVVTITVPENNSISIFYLSLMMYQMSDNCNEGAVEIRDGEDENGALLQKVCGYSVPNPVFSTKNKVYIKSWLSGGDQGIYASYDLIYTSSDQGRGCGGEIYNYRGRFSSPLYPMGYRNPKKCTWNVKVPIGMRIGLKFSAFDIEGSCEENYVEVTTFKEDQSNKHKFCRNDIPAELYSDRRMEVNYQSSFLNNGTGFIALFDAL